MASKLDIVNLALVKLEIGQTLQSLDVDDPHARRATAHWDLTLDCVLREHPGNFARTEMALALLALEPVYHTHAYAYPSDCLQVIKLTRMGSPRAEAYEIGRVEGVKAILADIPEAGAVYIARIDDPVQFSSHFADAVSWRLAANMSLAVQASAERFQSAMQAYAAILAQARYYDARESLGTIDHDTQWTKARR